MKTNEEHKVLEPAFPCEILLTHQKDVMISDPNAAAFGETVPQTKHQRIQMPGMSLCDWFAGMALQGLLAACSNEKKLPRDPEGVASYAYKFADAMMAERQKAGA